MFSLVDHPPEASASMADDDHVKQTVIKSRIQSVLAQIWLRKIRQELGIPNMILTERDRSRGAKESMATSIYAYQCCIRSIGDDIFPILDRLQVCEDHKDRPVERLNVLAQTLAGLDELDLDQQIMSSMTLSGQIDSICASLVERPQLCSVCVSASERIAANSARCWTSIDELWPPREFGNFPVDAFVDGIRFIPPENIDESSEIPPNVIRHHANGANLFRSAEKCSFCAILRMALILDSFRKCSVPFDRPTAPLIETILTIRMGKGINDESQKVLDGIQTSQNSVFLMVERLNDTGKGALGHIRVLWQKPESMIGNDGVRKVVFTKLKLFAPDTPQLKDYISSTRPILNSGSLEAMSLMKQWLEDCRTCHKWCRDTICHKPIAEDEPQKLPTRVIDVGTPKSGDSVQLIVTAGTCGYWVALSHCWGEKENHPLKTTRKNISEHLTKIKMSSLPKTFQDAVVTTRALGFRYLWIDSLCIVQDDEEEWRSESRMMATIYEHAVLTLAASAAKDSKQGLFVERPYGKIKYPSTQLPFIQRDAQTGENKTLGEYSISLDWRQEPFMEHMDPMFSPIYRRGWCTQEFILSRRIIHFLDEGMMWVCKEKAVDETGHFVLAAKRHSEPDWATEWDKIITDHSLRDFTFESDRLVSLDGLAREVAKAENNSCKLEEYFYGTWLSDVPQSILWASYRVHDRETACPSWSWASCKSAVWLRFKDFDNMRPDDGLIGDCEVQSVDRETGIMTMSAKSIDITEWDFTLMEPLSSEDLMGKKGRIAFRQPLIQGYSISSSGAEVSGWIEFDDERDASNMTKPVFYLHLAEAEYWEKPITQYWGILLENDPARDGAFKRVGMASLFDTEILKTLERQVIAIA